MSGTPRVSGAERSFEYWMGRLLETFDPLPDKPEETADSTLRALWLAACGLPVSAAKAAAVSSLPSLDGASAGRLSELLRRRQDGVPLAHLTGRQSFMGLEFLSGPEALIPRRETELLARASLELLSAMCVEEASPLVIDLCTGCGNIALALAYHARSARVFAGDLSAEAVALAERNALALGGDARAEFRVGDLLEPFESGEFLGRISMITCNPPYISSAKVGSMRPEISGHEPRLAFDGGPLGVSILLRLLGEAPRYLRPGGWLCFEVGEGQGAAMARKAERTLSFDQVRIVDDGRGRPRAVAARRS